jgi:hypothetical protein
MSSPYAAFTNDENIETKVGIILEYDDYCIRIARAGGSNKKFEKAFLAKMKPYRHQMETDTLKDAVANRLMIELYVDTIVLEWSVKNEEGKYVPGIHGLDGSILTYSRENAITIFEKFPDLFKDVQAQSRKSSLFKALEAEETAKNSAAV